MIELVKSRGLPLHVSHGPSEAPVRRVLVAVHGISRNAEAHARWLRGAVGDDVAVVAPCFEAATFPHYQRLGLDLEEPRADLWFDEAIADYAAQRGVDIGRFDLFGFSGGAQFAHRFAMLNPHRVRSLHLASAGYYTFPDPEIVWPRGLRRLSVADQIRQNLNFFLRLPINVYVGAEDVERDGALRKGPRIDAHQGETRLARARNWTAEIAARQTALGAAPAKLIELAGVGHDFDAAAAHGALGAGIAASLAPDEAAAGASYLKIA